MGLSAADCRQIGANTTSNEILGSIRRKSAESHDGNAYRAVYTVRLEKAMYVLHAFQKKSPSGIRTAQRDVDLVAARLNTAERDHEEHYGKQKR